MRAYPSSNHRNCSQFCTLQAHPHKELAEKLHMEQPAMYKDPNHKPEMAIALTEFQAMCGFRPIAETLANIEAAPEFASILTPDGAAPDFPLAVLLHITSHSLIRACRCPALEVIDRHRQQLATDQECIRAVFTSYMRVNEEATASALSAYIARLSTKADLSFHEQLVLRLSEEYPGDPGAFAPLLLNCIKLQPGEAFFMGPDEPHAYLYGDILECMACSDNVVRAGLTPKFKDTNTLCEMLTYRCGSAHYIAATATDEYTRTYVPPVQEFEVATTSLPAETAYTLATLQSASIVLVLQGGCSFTHPRTARTIEAHEVRPVAPFDFACCIGMDFIRARFDLLCSAGHNRIYWRGRGGAGALSRVRRPAEPRVHESIGSR